MIASASAATNVNGSTFAASRRIHQVAAPEVRYVLTQGRRPPLCWNRDRRDPSPTTGLARNAAATRVPPRGAVSWSDCSVARSTGGLWGVVAGKATTELVSVARLGSLVLGGRGSRRNWVAGGVGGKSVRSSSRSRPAARGGWPRCCGPGRSSAVGRRRIPWPSCPAAPTSPMEPTISWRCRARTIPGIRIATRGRYAGCPAFVQQSRARDRGVARGGPFDWWVVGCSHPRTHQ